MTTGKINSYFRKLLGKDHPFVRPLPFFGKSDLQAVTDKLHASTRDAMAIKGLMDSYHNALTGSGTDISMEKLRELPQQSRPLNNMPATSVRTCFGKVWFIHFPALDGSSDVLVFTANNRMYHLGKDDFTIEGIEKIASHGASFIPPGHEIRVGIGSQALRKINRVAFDSRMIF